MGVSLRKKSYVLRKGFDYLHQVKRDLLRLRCSAQDYVSNPPLIANSFPKSGTHLLVQILQGLPRTVWYGTHISTMPTIPYKERSAAAHQKLLSAMAPGEVVGAHLFFDPAYADQIGRMHGVHFFIYRDLRDVAVSDAHYLGGVHKFHRMHKYFAALPGIEQRIEAAICGFRPDDCNGYWYPNIGERWKRYKGWLGRDDVCAVKFEDIVSVRRTEALREMAEFYRGKVPTEHGIDALAKILSDAIAPEKSHTFRKGEVGGWRTSFTEIHKKKMKEVAGDALIELGYESDFDW